MSISVEMDLSALLKKHERELLADWLKNQMKSGNLRADLINENELQQQSRDFLKLLVECVPKGTTEDDILIPAFAPLRYFLDELASTRASQGFTPTETTVFIFSLKQPLFTYLTKESNIENVKEDLLEKIWNLTQLIDKLGLYTFEQYQKSREEVITRQQQEMLELSTPVVKLWEGVLVLPLIGTLDSARTQQVMEDLLHTIVATNSSVAIIDITGIPMVDTLVAQYLIKTISAARLMGADCIVSGIRPQIAQTIVHLGISLQEVATRSTLADAIKMAMQKAGFTITRIN